MLLFSNHRLATLPKVLHVLKLKSQYSVVAQVVTRVLSNLLFFSFAADT